MAPAVTTVVMAPQHMAPLQPYEGLKCVATTHLVLECIECVISGICAFIWLMWVAFQEDSFEGSQEAKVHLLIGPWHLIAIGATIAAGGIGCNCVYHDAAPGHVNLPSAVTDMLSSCLMHIPSARFGPPRASLQP